MNPRLPVLLGAIVVVAGLMVALVISRGDDRTTASSADPIEAVSLNQGDDSADTAEPGSTDTSTGGAVISAPARTEAGPTTSVALTTDTVEPDEFDPDVVESEGALSGNDTTGPNDGNDGATTASGTNEGGGGNDQDAGGTQNGGNGDQDRAGNADTGDADGPGNTDTAEDADTGDDADTTVPTIPPATDGTCRVNLAALDGRSGVVDLGTAGSCAAVGATIQAVNLRDDLASVRWGRDIQICQRHPAAEAVAVTAEGADGTIDVADGLIRDPGDDATQIETIVITFRDQQTPVVSPRPIAVCRTDAAELSIVHRPTG